MVEALAVDGVGGAAKGEVPLEEIGFERLSRVVWGGRVGYLGGFSNWARRVSRRGQRGTREEETYVCAEWWATWS